MTGKRWATPLSALAIGRYPAPVWTMIAWAGFSGLNLLFAITFPPNHRPPTLVSISVCVYVVLIVVFLLVLGPRTPLWLLWVFLAGAVLSTTLLVGEAYTVLGLAVFALPYIIYASYAALWGSRRVALAFLVAIGGSYLLVLTLRGAMPYMLVTWLLITTICAGLVLLLNYLVSSLTAMAGRDALTGLLNRAGLQSLVGDGPVGDPPISVAVIDLDGLKRLNDTEGHAAGDAAIASVGRTLREGTRQTDIVARTGGDEFVVVMAATNAEQAAAIVVRLREASDFPWSHGIAQWRPGLSYDDVVADADALMYQAKRAR